MECNEEESHFLGSWRLICAHIHQIARIRNNQARWEFMPCLDEVKKVFPLIMMIRGEGPQWGGPAREAWSTMVQ